MESNNNNIVTDFQPSQQLTDLIQSLEQATLMAKQLPTTSDSDHHRLIFTSLSSAQHSLSSFLSNHHNFADNSVSSAVDEPMMTADEDEEELNSKDSSMEKIEEKMRESLCIQNKRLKRPISPSSVVAEERRRFEDRVLADFDSPATRLRNLDLVFQFHA
ncbi:Velvet complex subunit B [Bienertia sinuspersici]